MDAVAKAREFYAHLFTALEHGKRKAEKGLIACLLAHFGCPDSQADPPGWLVRHVAPEAAMGWVLEQTRPFAQMLEQIYDWLAAQRATVGGNIREVEFDFAALQQKVRFDLDAFPKTYLRQWVDRRSLTRDFDPIARGRLRVDTPHYWQDKVDALSNLSHATVLRPDVFDRLPEPNRRLIASRVAYVLVVLNTHYARKTTPAGIGHWQFANHPVLFVRDESEWQRALELAAKPESDGGTAGSPVAAELSRVFSSGIATGSMVDGSGLEALATHAPEPSEGTSEPEPVLGPELERDDTYAFLQAYDLCFPPREVPVRKLIDIVDRVLLPFWRHRWRLFEIWSLIWLIEILPAGCRPRPRLTPGQDRDGNYVWTLAGGDAALPVASTELGKRTLAVWFQLRTPLPQDSARRFGQGHIEPDIRVREEADGRATDRVILELKDRHLAKGYEEKRVARMYATTGAPVVCVANYSLFGSKSLHGQVHTEAIGRACIYLVDEFRPDTVPTEIRDAICRAVNSQDPPDVLIDVSGSIKSQPMLSMLDGLAGLGVEPARWFVWSDVCAEIAGHVELADCFGGGVTKLDKALSQYGELGQSRAIILTDEDGARQFKELVARGAVSQSRYLCLDLAVSVDRTELERWLSGTAE